MKLAIFDLDGVVVSTDALHFRAWKSMADGRGYRFDQELNDRLRGVGRADCLRIILAYNDVAVSDENFNEMLAEKNDTYRDLLTGLTPDDVLPGVVELLTGLRKAGIATAIGSSSRNTPLILKQIGMANAFDVVVDGNSITHSKPHPEVFERCAAALSCPPANCVVFEDAQAGIDAAVAAGMTAIAVGEQNLTGAVRQLRDLSRASVDMFF